MLNKLITIIFIAFIFIPNFSSAHPGRTNSEGCHTNKKTGEYHCHKKKKNYKRHYKQARTYSRKNSRAYSRYFAKDYNCRDFTSQKEAQEFFISSGGPAWDPYKLDRDKDGIACENLK